MDPYNFSLRPIEEVGLLFQKSSLTQLKTIIPHLSSLQLMAGIQALEDPMLEKLPAVADMLTATPLLESIGKILTEKQFLILLEAYLKDQFSLHKLLSILVGLPSHIFIKTIETAPREYLEPLKKEELLEPLQNHLNILGHNCEKERVELHQIEEKLFKEIQELNKKNLNNLTLKEIKTKIISLENRYQRILGILDRALSILWNTSRIDLLDRFSRLKESANLQYVLINGTQAHRLGLQVYLKKILNDIYEEESSQENGKILNDDDLTIDGLTKLGVWYLKDYWEVGLLPKIKKFEELDQNPTAHLFHNVQENLDRLGIKTIKDLKNANIYSKDMLIEYIQKHANDLEE